MFEQYFMEIFDNVSINIDPVLITLTPQLNIGGTDLSPNMLPISLLLRKKKSRVFVELVFEIMLQVKWSTQSKTDMTINFQYYDPYSGFV